MPNLSDFKILTFDTYGTLIDWESGIYNALLPLIERTDPAPDRNQALEVFGEEETHLELTQPGLIYSSLLSECYHAIAKRWNIEATNYEARIFGQSVKHWPAFPDSPAALQKLRQHYLMATLTNCDRISYMGSNARLEFEWDSIYTAQDAGSYKPALRNFEFLFERVRQDFGILPQEILHVAQSLTHDMVPATKMGMNTVWINRRHGQEGFGATIPPKEPYNIDWEFSSMKDFAEAVENKV
jgi:2-haloalkanoic acid dehalogenase type II